MSDVGSWIQELLRNCMEIKIKFLEVRFVVVYILRG